MVGIRACHLLASLHRAHSVVVKVRYPDVERQLRGDVRTIKIFAKIAQPVHVPGLEEIEKQFMTEFDYVQEGKQLEEVRLNLTKAGLAGPGKLCRVPKAYLEYCTQRVLVMEELKGDKLAVGLKHEMKVQAEREGKTVDVFYKEMKDKERGARESGEELKGPSAEEYSLYISLLDKKRKFSNVVSRLHNWSLAFLPGKESKEVKDRSDLPVNHAKMIDDLLYIHGHEVLVDGLFNGGKERECVVAVTFCGSISLFIFLLHCVLVLHQIPTPGTSCWCAKTMVAQRLVSSTMDKLNNLQRKRGMVLPS